jgi:hypothetical protein
VYFSAGQNTLSRRRRLRRFRLRPRPQAGQLLEPALPRPLVVAEAQEDGLPQQDFLGPLLVADLADELGLDPDVIPARRQRPFARALGQDHAVELPAHAGELLVGEPAARASHVDEPLALVRAQVERAEAGASSLRLREAHHHEVAGAVEAQLHPVR